MFENAPRVDADIFFIRIKKMRFQKDPDTCGRGLKFNLQAERSKFFRYLMSTRNKSKFKYTKISCLQNN